MSEESKGAEPPDDGEIDTSVLEEGSYYLSKLDLDAAAIAERFEIPRADVLRHKTRYEKKLRRGCGRAASTSAS